VGDSFQTLVDVDATAEQADDLGQRLVSHLIDRGILVDGGMSEVFPDTPIYGPGPHADSVVTPSVYLDRCRRLPQFGFVRRDGLSEVRLITGRTVFWGDGGFDLTCPACGHRNEADTEPSLAKGWSNAVDEWYAGTGPGLLACPTCGQAAAITEWLHDPPWAFAYLGLEFWDWGGLRREFIDEVSALLGHRVMVVYGKI
jgi:hypothetical protein